MSDSTKSFANFCREYVAAMNNLGPPGTAFRRRGKPETDEQRQEREDERLVWHVSFAARLVNELDGFGRAVVFSRPASLGTDLDVHRSTVAARKAKSKREDRAAAEEFWRWRNHVMEAESRDAGNIEAVLRAAFNAAPSTHAREHVRKLRAHIESTWGVRVPWPIESAAEIPEIARKLARNTSTMPTWLFLGERPPRYVETGGGVIEDTDY